MPFIDPFKKQEVREKYNFRPFVEAPPSKEPQENIIDLDAIDLSAYQEGPEGLEGRKKLANQLEKSLTKYGFFKLVNHGMSHEFLETVKSLSQSTFEESDEVKNNFVAGERRIEEEADRELGVVRGSGYKPKGYWTYTNNTKDKVEFFNIRHFNHDDIYYNRTEYPEFVRYNLDDIAAYFRLLHQEVLRRVLTLIDLILELPEGTLFRDHFRVIQNNIPESGTGYGRFLLYHEVDDEYNEKTSKTWLRGHSDASGLTFILSQPILSLQIREHDTNLWKYVSHTPDALVVNIGDTFQHLSGGYFKSSIHRVVTPPADQRQYKRNTAIYFCYPKLTTFIDPEELQSPKLERLGIRRDTSLPRVTVEQWDEAKGQFFNKTSANRQKNISFFGRESVGSLIQEEKLVKA